MDQETRAKIEQKGYQTTASDALSAQRSFSMAMVISGIRCVLAYVLLPFVLPILGLAPGIGPGLGILFGLIAIGANLYSLQRFWQLDHPWKKVMTAVHAVVILFLVVLIGIDAAALISGPSST